MPVYAAGTYGILQTSGGQGVFLRLAWDSGFPFSWEVAKSLNLGRTLRCYWARRFILSRRYS